MCKDAVQVDGSATPGWAGGETPGIGATPKKQRSRWDETPMGVAPSATPMMGATPSMTPGATPLMTPGMAAGMETPSPSAMPPGVSTLRLLGASSHMQTHYRLASGACMQICMLALF